MAIFGRSYPIRKYVTTSKILLPSSFYALTGVAGTTGTGTLAVSITHVLTGSAGTSNVSSVIATPTFTLLGKFGTTGLGFVTALPVNYQTVCNQFRVDILNGLHAFGPSVVRATATSDTFKLALYYTTASRGPSDTVYTSTGEVSGTNYSAGGVAVPNSTPPASTGAIAYWTPSSSIIFTNVTISTAFDAMLLYNDTSSLKLAVAVFIFGSQIVTAGDFTVSMPVNTADDALIRLT